MLNTTHTETHTRGHMGAHTHTQRGPWQDATNCLPPLLHTGPGEATMHPKAGQQCRGQSMVSCCPRAGLTVAAPSQGHGNLWGRLQPGSSHTAQAGGTQGHPAGRQPGEGNRRRTLKCHRTNRERGLGVPRSQRLPASWLLCRLPAEPGSSLLSTAGRLQRSKPASLRQKLPPHTCAVHIPPPQPDSHLQRGFGPTLGPWAALLWS